MLMDRLDWIDGWPTVRAGAWASEGPVAPPVTTGPVDDDFDAGLRARDWRRIAAAGSSAGTATRARTCSARLAGRSPGMLLARDRVPGDPGWRSTSGSPRAVVGAVGGTGTAGLVVRWSGPRDHVVAAVDASRSRLVVVSTRAGRETVVSEPLPASFDPTTWHVLAATLRGDDRPSSTSPTPGWATPTRCSRPRWPRPGATPASWASWRTTGRSTSTTSWRRACPPPSPSRSRRPRSAPSTRRTPTSSTASWPPAAPGCARTRTRGSRTARCVADPGRRPGRRSERRGVAAARGAAGRLRGRDQVDHRPRHGDGAQLPAGRVGRVRRRRRVRAAVARGDLEHPPDRVRQGAALRRRHPVRRDAGRHPRRHHLVAARAHARPRERRARLRAGTSRDGVHWTWGGTWTLPAGTEPRIGLVSHGGDAPQATARFDYLRVYR